MSVNGVLCPSQLPGLVCRLSTHPPLPPLLPPKLVLPAFPPSDPPHPTLHHVALSFTSPDNRPQRPPGRFHSARPRLTRGAVHPCPSYSECTFLSANSVNIYTFTCMAPEKEGAAAVSQPTLVVGQYYSELPLAL